MSDSDRGGESRPVQPVHDTARERHAAFWNEFIASLAMDDPRRGVTPDAFSFGGEGALADELAALVLAGRKKATTSLPIEYTALDEPLPRAGDLSIVLSGTDVPVAVIERTSVELVGFDEVTAEYAAHEGEGDGSLGYWRRAHVEYFTGVCARLGGSFDAATPVLCQRFRVVWPQPSANGVDSP